ncbi:MAG: DUF169 domain-containing protein [Burkholderiales bacterium]|nr:DUF169 domain-containing protein [Burkholderiales bacterium]
MDTSTPTQNADPVTTGADFAALTAELEKGLRLRSIPFGMKLCATVQEMQAVPRIRRPQAIHTLDQLVAQTARLGWTLGVTSEDLVGDQCRAVVGLGGQDPAWFEGQPMVGVWYATQPDSAAHQAAMNLVPAGRYQSLVIAPLAKWGAAESAPPSVMDQPDIALFYATPGAMMYFINGLQWQGYERFDWSCVGESACADSWGRALKTRQPSLSIPCFAERRYGGVTDDEMLMAAPVEYFAKAVHGMRALARSGLRYPFPSYGIQQDVRAGMAASYPSPKAASR